MGPFCLRHRVDDARISDPDDAQKNATKFHFALLLTFVFFCFQFGPFISLSLRVVERY